LAWGFATGTLDFSKLPQPHSLAAKALRVYIRQ